MRFECPECNASMSGGTPGAVVACPRCANPIAVPDQPPRVQAPPTPVEAPVTAEVELPDTAKMWRTATIVVLILAVGHVALYLLLTMEARDGVHALESRHGASKLLAARKPKEQPTVGTPAYATWSQSVALWESSQAYQTHVRHRDMLALGLGLSFAILLGITVWALAGVLSKAARMRRAHAQE